MRKDFIKWHKKKAWLHESKERPYFHEGEVWFCAYGLNIGFEQDGSGDAYLRPILVVRKFNSHIFWGVPLTKILKEGMYYLQVSVQGELRTVILSQLRLVDSKRLQYKIAFVAEQE